MTTKVKNTEIYKDSQGEHVVTKGKLILIEILEKEYIKNPNVSIKLIDRKFYKPIIISETEPIEEGDKRWFYDSQYLSDTSENEARALKHNKGIWKKILATPENFSEKHLQAIVNKKLNHGDEVYVKVSEQLYEDDALKGEFRNKFVNYHNNNFITLFPIKNKSIDIYSGDLNSERIAMYKKLTHEYNISESSIREIFSAGADWALSLKK